MPVEFDSCCGFVTDLRNAAILIVLLAIVTNPLMSWILVRHTYAVRASSLITLDKSQPDSFNINAENFLKIGFGSSGARGPSCLQPPEKEESSTEEAEAGRQGPTFRAANETESDMVKAAKYLGWVVTGADLVFLIASIYFLVSIFREYDKTAAGVWIWSCAVTVLFSFIYAMIYVHVCITIGNAFPVFEFGFALLDLLLWVYFILVIMAYRSQSM